MHIVYKTTNLINEKYYIGVHKVKGNDKYLGSGKILNKAILKYGIDSFQRVTLKEFDNDKDAYDYEREIVNIELVQDKNCYNITIGGGSPPISYGKDHHMYGKTHSKETIKKMSDIKKGKYTGKKNPMYGKTHSKESLKKMSDSLRGMRTGKDHPMYGKTHAKESLKKMSDIKKGQNNPNAKVWVINGKLFYSPQEAGDFFNVSGRTISGYWCNPKSKFHITLCYSFKKAK